MVQVMSHKHGDFCEMLSCAPSRHSPWPYYLMRTTFSGHKEQGLRPLHNIANRRCQQL